MCRVMSRRERVRRRSAKASKSLRIPSNCGPNRKNFRLRRAKRRLRRAAARAAEALAAQLARASRHGHKSPRHRAKSQNFSPAAREAAPAAGSRSRGGTLTAQLTRASRYRSPTARPARRLAALWTMNRYGVARRGRRGGIGMAAVARGGSSADRRTRADRSAQRAAWRRGVGARRIDSSPTARQALWLVALWANCAATRARARRLEFPPRERLPAAGAACPPQAGKFSDLGRNSTEF